MFRLLAAVSDEAVAALVQRNVACAPDSIQQMSREQTSVARRQADVEMECNAAAAAGGAAMSSIHIYRPGTTQTSVNGAEIQPLLTLKY
jgi:hypothetical protein